MPRQKDGFTWASIDLLWVTTIIFMTIAVLALRASQTNGTTKPNANITATLYWTKTADADVDLWVTGPDEANPVGWRNRNGFHWNLVRDDLGRSQDPESRNVEEAFARGAPAGEYVINAMLYTDMDHRLPLRVWLVVTDGQGFQLIRSEDYLTHEGQEITLARFRLDANGHIAGDVTHVYRPLFYPAGTAAQ